MHVDNKNKMYSYKIYEINFLEDGQILLGVKQISSDKTIHISALQLFEEDWLCQFSPQNIRAIAGFAYEDKLREERKKIAEFENIQK